jgi:molybdate transport system ATP-binding protein
MIEVDVTHRLGDFVLDAKFATAGRFIAFFGPSGSGKTSLVQAIAGLIAPKRARIAIDDHTLIDTERGIALPPYRRKLGYVFQDGRLFPHLSVRQNLLYGAWFAKAQVKKGPSLGQVCRLLGIEQLLDRHPQFLSGGEKQRVAIGRALLAAPQLLLLDEPLAALDEARKQEIMPYLERLRDEAHIPIIYVSHSIAEVARLSDTLVVLSEGRVQAAGPSIEVMQSLEFFGTAEKEEAGALVEGSILRHDDRYGLTTLVSRAGEWRVPLLDLAVGKRVRMRIRSRDVMIALVVPDGMSAVNVFPAVVTEIGPLSGPGVDIKLNCNREILLARLTRFSVERLNLHPGTAVFAIIKSVSLDKSSVGPAWNDYKTSDAGAVCDQGADL